MSRFIGTDSLADFCPAFVCVMLHTDVLLNSMQVEVLMSQLQSTQQQAEGVPALRRQLQTATSQKEECEMKLHDMVEENKGIQDQACSSIHLS
jgi:hypothetical protein